MHGNIKRRRCFGTSKCANATNIFRTFTTQLHTHCFPSANSSFPAVVTVWTLCCCLSLTCSFTHWNYSHTSWFQRQHQCGLLVSPSGKANNCLKEQHHLNLKARNKRAPKFEVVLRCDDIYALNQWGRTPIPEGSQPTRCLTLAGLPISSRDEAHVALAAVASRHVQAVAALAQVAVLRTLVTVCGQTQSDTVITLNDATGDEKWRVLVWNMHVCMYVCVWPEQKKPSPENPSLHVQRYEPIVLWHSALLLHLCVPFEHSSRSATQNVPVLRVTPTLNMRWFPILQLPEPCPECVPCFIPFW